MRDPSEFSGGVTYPAFLYSTDSAGAASNITDTTALTIALELLGKAQATAAGITQFPLINPHDRGSTQTKPRGLAIWPVAADDENDKFQFGLRLWQRIKNPKWQTETGATSESIEWQPFALWTADATLGSQTGVAGGIGTGLLKADTISAAVLDFSAALKSLSGMTAVIHSPADNSPACVVFENVSYLADGFDLLVDLDGAGVTAATVGANFLVQYVY